MMSLFLMSLKRAATGVLFGCVCLTGAMPALASEPQGK